MRQLSYILTLNCNIVVRFKKKPTSDDTLIITFSGGPCLSNSYMDIFSNNLAESMSINSVLIDLPNHDNSILVTEKYSLQYQDHLEYLWKAVNELKETAAKIILLGHSFGSRIILDLINRGFSDFYKIILISTQENLEFSSKFLEEKDKINFSSILFPKDSNEFFKAYWYLMLPLYFTKKPNEEIIKLLTKEVFWNKNQDIISSISLFHPEKSLLEKMSKLYFLQGENDLLPPKDNFNRLQAKFPLSQYKIINNTGHFPMLEKPDKLIEIIRNIVVANNNAT